ncbi:MAG: prolipoprotein diacylglyceryl transferase [Armatimonadetes bacterium]|nr:prolipoprotein diacylglyceryl transferase [Armatimonadota bacterium]
MHSVLFKIGPFAVHSYGLMVVLGFMAAALWLIRAGKEDGITSEMVFDLMLYIMAAAVVMSRLVFVLLEWRAYAPHPVDALKIWEGGLSFHGGLLGGILAALWYCRRHAVPFWKLADHAAPGLALGYAIARIGCFLNGCCYGTPTGLPWACRFQDPPLSGHLTPPSHPTQLYATLINLGVFFMLASLWKRRRYDGQTFGQYLIAYAAYRFFVEFFRKGATARDLALGLTEAQWASIVMALLALVLMRYLNGRAERKKEEGVSRNR